MIDNLAKILDDFDDVPFTMSAISYDLKYVNVNKKLAQHFNQNKNNFKNKDIGSFSKNKYFRNLVEQFKNSDSESFAKEIESVAIDGKTRNYYILGFKRKACMFFLGIDVSEVKSMEHKLLKQEKMSSLGENMAGIIHEINTPLHAMLSQIELLDLKYFKRNQAPTVEQWNEFREKFNNRFHFLNNIIKSIQSFSYDSDLYLQEMDLHNLTNQALTLLSYKIKKSNIKVSLKKFEFKTKINASRYIQVIVNLINNSIYELEDVKDSWIKISFEENDSNFILNFTDSGKGIPLDIQENIFDNFFTTKELGSGTGIGLSLCKKYLNKYNADLHYKEINNHTNFQISFNKEKNA